MVVETDDEEVAAAVQGRLLAGNLDAYVRDVEDGDREDSQASIQVIVPVEEAAAAMLELELKATDAQPDEGRVDRAAELGFAIDDLEMAELTATGGPEYDLDELGDDAEVRTFLNILLSERIRFALDRDGNLIVHYNDESKVDELIERLFSYDLDGVDQSDETLGSVVGPTDGIGDVDGRPAVDDVTANDGIITQSTTSPWLFAVAIVAVIVVLVLLVL